MNSRKLQLAALIAASLVAGSAFADGAEYEYPQTVRSTVSRADVQAETIAAQRSGALSRNDFESAPVAKAEVKLASNLQRVQVLAEAREARRLGLIAEGDGSAPVPSASQLEQVRLAGVQSVQNHLAASTRK